jgi:phenylacetate-CoA ligase
MRRLLNTAAIARAAAGQRRIPYLPDDQRHALRDARVRDIVRHAAATVPHYRDLFRARSIDPREIRTAADLARLPPLARDEIQEAPERFVSEEFRGERSLVFPTNGTTGTPLAVRHDRGSVLENIALGERERVVEAGLTGKRLRYVVLDVNYGPRDTGFQVLRFYREQTVMPLRPARHMLRITDPFERVVQAVNELKPDVFQGYGSYLEAFFEELDRSGDEMHRPAVVLYGSDTMSPAGRRFIEERFGVPVISRYNAVEAFKIGFTCQERDGVHLEDDLCHVRVLDDAGGAQPPGEVGEVVISNLVNRATVLLNYRLGDVAARRAGACACGRLTPMLADVGGRLERTLRSQHGGLVPEGAIQVRLKDRGAHSFQLVQTAVHSYELKVVADDYEGIRPKLVEELRTLLGEGASIETSRHEQLEPGPRGVFQYVIPLP